MNEQDLIYEQCVWHQHHVEAIYLNLASKIIADNQWHEFPAIPDLLGWYRVFESTYFQAIYAVSRTSFVEDLMAMSPVDSQDDAKWTMRELERGEAYAITSPFALTPGPFSHQQQVDEWLERHGLGLDPQEYYVAGVAYFTDLDPGCVRDAMDRLSWLEHALENLNDWIQEIGQEFWRQVKAESDAIVSQLDVNFDPEEIIPLPARFQRTGWKRREPIQDDKGDG